MGSRHIAIEEWGMGRTGLLADFFMVQRIQGFPWPRGRSKGKGLEIVWPGGHQSSDTSTGHVVLPCSLCGAAAHLGKQNKGVSGNAATECRYSWVFMKQVFAQCSILDVHMFEGKKKGS